MENVAEKTETEREEEFAKEVQVLKTNLRKLRKKVRGNCYTNALFVEIETAIEDLEKHLEGRHERFLLG